jgi:hypothetical protein
MNAKRKQAMPRGRRRFKSKFASDDAAFDPYNQPRPYGEDWPVINIANRRALLKFFLPVIENLPPDAPLKVVPDVPMNFAQVANWVLGQKQTTLHNAELAEKLHRIQARNDAPGNCHPNWNNREVPPELLHEALSQCAKNAVKDYPVIQRALARLYAVAWFGRNSDSVEAKKQLEKLLPSGRANPITKHIPEIASKFREMRRWIRESNELMKREFPHENDWVEKLAELYAESKEVISAALRPAETPFLTERLHEVLNIPKETIRKALSKLPASQV